MNEFAKAYLTAKSSENRKVALYLDYVDICGGYMHDAILFSQIMYWHTPNEKTKQSKLRVKHDEHYWIAKHHDDWYAECRVKAPMVRKALKRLEDRNLIHYTVSGFSKKKTPLIRINWDGFKDAMNTHYDTMYQPIMIQCIEPNTDITSTENTKEKESLSLRDNTDAGVGAANDDKQDTGQGDYKCVSCNKSFGDYIELANNGLVCLFCYMSPQVHVCKSCGKYRQHSIDGQQACDECSDPAEQPKATMAEVADLTFGTRDNPVHVGALCEVPADETIVAPEDTGHSQDAIKYIVDAPQPKPEKKRKRKPTKPTNPDYKPLFAALSEAAPGDAKDRTRADNSIIGKAVNDLLEVNAKPDEMAMLAAYCHNRFSDGPEPNYTAMAMAKHYSAFKQSHYYQMVCAQPAPVPEPETDVDDRPLTAEQKAEADKLWKVLLDE
jgi:hypothetical protein